MIERRLLDRTSLSRPGLDVVHDNRKGKCSGDAVLNLAGAAGDEGGDVGEVGEVAPEALAPPPLMYTFGTVV